MPTARSMHAAFPDALVHQVDVGPQGERGVGVPEPLLHLLDVPALPSKSSDAQVCRKLWKVAQGSPTLSRVGLRTGARGSIDMKEPPE